MANADLTVAELRSLFVENGGTFHGVANALGMPTSTLQSKMGSILKDLLMSGDAIDPEVVEMSVRLAKQKQAAQDINRVERKAFREHARYENAVSVLAENIAAQLKAITFSEPPAIINDDPSGAGIIIHWSDQHLNERVELPHNKYDWEIAGKRLRRHVQEALEYCRMKNVKHVLVAMTGDLLNSDRRLDELMANGGNRSKACVLAVDLYQQALRELREHVNVSVCCVSGNESRIPKEVGWQSEVASDNYDFTIFEMLRMLLEDHDISFVQSDDPGEVVVSVAGQNCLFLHGHGSLQAKTQVAVQSIKGRYLQRGIAVDCVFWGHIHDCMIGDGYARSSSLVGSNDYGEKALGLGGRASQNIYLALPQGGFDALKVDLQDVDHVHGYTVQKRLEAYNTKSAKKAQHRETIFEVVV